MPQTLLGGMTPETRMLHMVLTIMHMRTLCRKMADHTYGFQLDLCNGALSEKTSQIFWSPLPTEYITVFSERTDAPGVRCDCTDPTTETLTAHARRGLMMCHVRCRNRKHTLSCMWMSAPPFTSSTTTSVLPHMAALISAESPSYMRTMFGRSTDSYTKHQHTLFCRFILAPASTSATTASVPHSSEAKIRAVSPSCV